MSGQVGNQNFCFLMMRLKCFQFPPESGEEAWADYYCGVDGSVVSSVASGSCTLQAELHQLRAVAATKSSIYFPLEYVYPGSSTFEVAVTNRAISGSETQSATISVVEGVDQAILVVDSCIPANEPYSFVLAPFTGMFPLLSYKPFIPFVITKTCLCNTLQFFTAVKMKNFR